MRLLHTADVHIGAEFKSLGDKGHEQREQLLVTFERVCRLAIEEKAQAMLVAGDLFDSPRVSETTLARVSGYLAPLDEAGVRVVILPGTHDREEPGGVWERWLPPPNVVVLTSERPDARLEEQDVAVHGIVGTGAKARARLAALVPDQGVRYNVAMLHGSLPMPGLKGDSTEEPIDTDAVARTGMDYAALGHWHGTAEQRFGPVLAAYPGSPEPIAFDQRGAGQVLVVELDETGVRTRPVPVGRRRLERMPVDLAHAGNAESVVRAIEAKADPDLGLEVSLVGVRPQGFVLDADAIEEALASRFFRLRVVDSSHPSLDAVDPSCYPEATIIGRFVRRLEADAEGADDAMRAEIADALSLGVALLEGREVPL